MECKYIECVFTNGGLGRILLCKRKEQILRERHPFLWRLYAAFGSLDCDCPEWHKNGND